VARPEYQLVQLRNGAQAVYAAGYDEKMHPGLGPAAEAEALYVRQLNIRERMRQSAGEFVVWDVGLGAAANALMLLRLTRDLPCPLRMISFDDTSGPLEFALTQPGQLGYLHGYESIVRQLLDQQAIEFTDGAHSVRWEFHLGDFPTWLGGDSQKRTQPPPHAVFCDAFSPAKNPAMWTLPVFEKLFRLLAPSRPCNLTTYSRSTMLRVTLLLAGFFVGRGVATGLKEETTVAANTLGLLEQPLGPDWLGRAFRSGSAEPMRAPIYQQYQLAASSRETLRAHPQFRNKP
jgi:hypothetical protein